MNELERDARKLVGKYFRSRDKKKEVYNYIHIMTIYLNEIKKRPVRLNLLRKTPREIREIVENYTKELIGYWKMILYQTNLGRQSPNHFPFKTFVPSCLYIMKRGVKIKNQVVIRQSQFLSTCLPETNTLDVYNINKTAQLLRDENHPLVTLKTTAPHSMVLIIKLFNPQPDTMIRLLYERVPKNKAPLMLHLDDPVTEILKLREEEMIHQLDDLPMGKYIVCGEARIGTEVYQTNCFETRIERLDSDSKQD